MFKSIIYLLVAMTVCIFSLVHFGVMESVYEVYSDIIEYTQGVYAEPNFQFLYFWFYLFLFFNIFLAVNLIKAEKRSHKLIDGTLILFTSYLMYQLTTTCEFIIWGQFLAPVIFAVSIVGTGFLWKLRFPDTFVRIDYYFSNKKISDDIRANEAE